MKMRRINNGNITMITASDIRVETPMVTRRMINGIKKLIGIMRSDKTIGI